MYRYAAAGVGFVGLNFVLGQAPQYGQGRNIFHSKPGQVPLLWSIATDIAFLDAKKREMMR